MKRFRVVLWHQLCVNMPPELLKRVEAAADYFGVTRTMLVREVLKDWLVAFDKMKGEENGRSS